MNGLYQTIIVDRNTIKKSNYGFISYNFEYDISDKQEYIVKVVQADLHIEPESQSLTQYYLHYYDNYFLSQWYNGSHYRRFYFLQHKIKNLKLFYEKFIKAYYLIACSRYNFIASQYSAIERGIENTLFCYNISDKNLLIIFHNLYEFDFNILSNYFTKYYKIKIEKFNTSSDNISYLAKNVDINQILTLFGNPSLKKDLKLNRIERLSYFKFDIFNNEDMELSRNITIEEIITFADVYDKYNKLFILNYEPINLSVLEKIDNETNLIINDKNFNYNFHLSYKNDFYISKLEDSDVVSWDIGYNSEQFFLNDEFDAKVLYNYYYIESNLTHQLTSEKDKFYIKTNYIDSDKFVGINFLKAFYVCKLSNFDYDTLYENISSKNKDIIVLSYDIRLKNLAIYVNTNNSEITDIDQYLKDIEIYLQTFKIKINYLNKIEDKVVIMCSYIFYRKIISFFQTVSEDAFKTKSLIKASYFSNIKINPINVINVNILSKHYEKYNNIYSFNSSNLKFGELINDNYNINKIDFTEFVSKTSLNSPQIFVFEYKNYISDKDNFLVKIENSEFTIMENCNSLIKNPQNFVINSSNSAINISILHNNFMPIQWNLDNILILKFLIKKI